MESSSRPTTEHRDEHWPLSDNDNQPGTPQNTGESTRPVSPISSISSAEEHGHDNIRVEDIISFGPVRTIQVKRNSVRHGKPQVVLTGEQNTGQDNVAGGASIPTTHLEEPWDIAHRTSRPWHRRLGKWTIFVLVIGTVLILGSFGFLLWLWFATESNKAWRSIISNNWAARSITLTSVVIRVAVFFQAAAATAMIASVHLERFDSRWSRSAILSINRATGTQPYTLLVNRVFSKRSWSLLIPTILLTFTTIALQFTSTILLSDLAIRSIGTGKSVDNSLGYGLSNDQRALIEKAEPDFTRVTPSSFPSFAEYAVDPGNQNGVDDTGVSIRALLPVSSGVTRESLLSYSGRATMINSRAICIAPSVVNVTFISNGPSVSPALPTQRVEGTINMGGILPRGVNLTISANDTNLSAPQARNISFSCSFQLSQSELEWPVSMCSVIQQEVGLKISSPFADGLMSDTSMYVLLNHTMNATVPISAVVGSGSPDDYNLGLQPVTIGNWTSKSTGPWINLTYAPNPIFSVQLSLCFTSFGALDSEIEANGTSDRSEPVLQSKEGRDVFGLNVSSVLTQLGVSNISGSASDRGILNLQNKTLWGFSTNVTASLDRTFGFSKSNTTYGLCTYCGTYESNPEAGTALGIDYTLSVIFQRALQAGGSPARALQALFTVVNGVQYYSRLPLFNLAAQATITAFQPVLYPFQHKGIIVLGVLLCTHLLLLIILTTVFLLKTKLSLLHQTWQSIAQVAIDMDGETVLYASGATDKEVRQAVERRGGDRYSRLADAKGVGLGIWRGERKVS